jgi:polysaccharide export outer membrane protein
MRLSCTKALRVKNMSSESLAWRRGKTTWFCLPVLVLTLVGGLAAQQIQRQVTPSPDDVPERRRPGLSELARDNYNRVAASVLQISDVLTRNPGLLVEVKLLIAKEASDNGQLVTDDQLTDHAVTDRLDKDLGFRAAVTRLLQRYGYLLPTVNPESETGKQQDLLLKERVRRQVQIESQEDADSLRPNPEASNQQLRTGYDSTQPDNWHPQPNGTTRQVSPSQQAPQEIGPPPQSPEQSSPRNAPSQLLRTDTTLPDSMDGGTQETLPSLAGAYDRQGGPLSAGESRSSSATSPNGASPRQGVNQLGMDRDMSSVTNPEIPSIASDLEPTPIGSSSTRNQKRPLVKDIPPVTMVHSPSPYADIPSLYDLYVQAQSQDTQVQRFGSEVFRDGLRDPRAVPMDLPVGADYVVGPGDSLSINLWGGTSARLVRTVDREGRLILPEAGPLQVTGRTLGEVQQAVEHALATQFRNTSADVSVSRLRTVRVYIVGEVRQPGAYDISSLSTALNALVAAGGVTSRGSLRMLQHSRGRQLLETIDAYDLLLHGVTPDAQKLENGDTLRVPPVGPQVTISGMVRRPAIYELNGEKSLADALELAGGILPAAALKHVEVQRLEAHEKRTMLSLDLSADGGTSAQLSSFQVQDGDEIHIFPIAPYNQDTIYLQGHVLRPGRYSYRKGMRLTDLISSYQDLLPEPSTRYAEIVRLNAPDFRPTVQSFDLASALANPSSAPTLEPLDTVRIFGRFDFEPPPAVWVGGEVRAPGKYVTSGQIHLRDAVYLAGGLSPDAALDGAQLFRTEADGNTEILSVDLGQALKGDPIQNILLQPRDRLLVHRNPRRVDPPSVEVRGEVAKPGRYPLTDNMHVEDLIKVSGGLKRSADTKEASLTRYPIAEKPGEHLELALASILNGNSTESVPLRNGDVLTIRQVPGWKDLSATVTLEGEVLYPGAYGIQPGEHLSSVLQRAGGYTPEAYPYGAVLSRSAVREAEDRARQELVRRVQAQQANIRLLPEADQDQKNAKITAIAQTQATLDQLRLTPPVGRLVIHISEPIAKWKNTGADVELRDGDVLVIPKRTGYVMINGQVFNPTAVSFRHGRSAKWYLSQAGGLTQLADKKGIFVIRADGSVVSAKNQSGWWGGDPLSANLFAGDTVVVPEKALNIGNKNWTALLQTAQVASSVALAVAAVHP